MPGSGLCPGYTVSRAILSDAAALVRGDRFVSQALSHASLVCIDDLTLSCPTRSSAKSEFYSCSILSVDRSTDARPCLRKSQHERWQFHRVGLRGRDARSRRWKLRWNHRQGELSTTTSLTRSLAYELACSQLLMRVFPDHYVFNSIYALFPFSTPETTKKILSDLNLTPKYYTMAPTPAAPWKFVTTEDGAVHVLYSESVPHLPRRRLFHCIVHLSPCLLSADHPLLPFFRRVAENKTNFAGVYGSHMESMVDNVGHLGLFSPVFQAIYKVRELFENHAEYMSRKQARDAALFPSDWQDKVEQSLTSSITNLMIHESWTFDNNKTFNLDVLRDVFVVRFPSFRDSLSLVH